MLRLIRFGPALIVAAHSTGLAHAGEDHGAAPGWTLDAWVTAPLGLLLFLFVLGKARLAHRSTVARPESWLFLPGWVVLTISLTSPLHEGGEVSFTLHMIEHELIMLVATLLLAASHAGGILAWGLPSPLRQALSGSWKSPVTWLWRRLTEPVIATIVQVAVMWAWHAPALFDRALDSQGWHVAQHASFIAASLLFWIAMLSPGRGGYLLSAACLFVTSLVGGALGALMALSQSPWYAAYAAMDMSGVGLDPLTDQQLAGLLMWVPGGLVHGAAALFLLYRWLNRSEERHALSSH
jgi:putative membrane protein